MLMSPCFYQPLSLLLGNPLLGKSHLGNHLCNSISLFGGGGNHFWNCKGNLDWGGGGGGGGIKLRLITCAT